MKSQKKAKKLRIHIDSFNIIHICNDVILDKYESRKKVIFSKLPFGTTTFDMII